MLLNRLNAKCEFRMIRTAAAVFCLLIVLSCSALAENKYEPTWQSLTGRELAPWLLDAKFGIYAHWGLYSVPAYRTEWYAKRMYDKNDSVYKHHLKTYGDPSKFGYKDFIPLFKAEKFDPDEWADLIAASGAKFAGIAVVHHDGFLLWHSKVNRWNAGNVGPRRDLYGELVRALRRKPKMKVIATFHHIRTFNWYLPDNSQARDEAREAGWDLFDPNYADLYWNRYTQAVSQLHYSPAIFLAATVKLQNFFVNGQHQTFLHKFLSKHQLSLHDIAISIPSFSS